MGGKDDHRISPCLQEIVLDILPLICGIDQVMILGLESRPVLDFLNTPFIPLHFVFYAIQF
jgi:hypothetical protein